MSNLKLSDEYAPNVDYHYDRIDRRKHITLDELLEELVMLTGGGVFALIFQLGDELPEDLEGVDVYDPRMATKLLAESNAQYLLDSRGVMIAGDKYRFKEMMLRKWGIDDGQSS